MNTEKIEELVEKTCALARVDVVNTFALCAVGVEELFFRFAETSASAHSVTVVLTLLVASVTNIAIRGRFFG